MAVESRMGKGGCVPAKKIVHAPSRLASPSYLFSDYHSFARKHFQNKVAEI